MVRKLPMKDRNNQEIPPRGYSWHYNVVDKYKSFTTEEIKADLEKNALPIAVLAQNIEGDFNLASAMRSANFFGSVDFYYHGRKHIDRRGCLGVYHYCNVHHLKSINEIKALKNKYVFVALENNVPNTVELQNFIWPKNKPIILIIGEEGIGISKEVLEMADYCVEIASKRGSVRSINVANACGIALFHFVLQNNYF